MKIRNILKELDKWSPFSLQESYDNSGLILGHPEMEINKILITLDITEAIIEEAIVSKYNLIISHHPIIFRGIKSLTDRTPEERILKKAIKNDIAIVALHTNLDNVHHGVNAKIGEILGLTELNILSPMEGELKKLVVYVPKDHLSPLRSAIFDAGAGHIGKYDMCSFGGSGHGTFRGGEGSNPFVGVQGNLHQETEIRLETIFPAHISSSLTKAIVDNHPYEEPVYDIYNLERENPLLGAGMTGILAKPVNEKEFLAQLKEKMGAKCIRHSCYRNKPIKKVAFCGGSGSFLIDLAISSKSDIFVSGDIKYHDFFKATKNMMIADIGHFESEQFTSQLIYDFLIEKFPTFAVRISDYQSNPIKYF